MCLLNERRSAAAPLLLALAGVAFLVSGVLNLRLLHVRPSPLVVGLQLLTPALFFVAAYLNYRRSR
jgi:hypothetical protein